LPRLKRSSWVADFETTTRADDCRVWGWGLADIDTATSAWDVKMGNDMEGFIDHIKKLHSIIYFHNLKFDGYFLIDYLFRVMRFEHVDKFPGIGEFSTIIDHMGQFYMITVNWGKGKKTEFRDSYKKLPFKVSRIAEAFKLPEAKGTIDYHAERPVGHVMTREERSYLAADVLIVARALKLEFDTGMTRLTVGSDSLEEFKTIMGKDVFYKMFPTLPETMDAEIRKAYRGGFTYGPPRFAGTITRSGRTYDVNSLYPSVMYDRLLPYGVPVFTEGYPETTPDYPLAIMSITFTAKLKKDHIPCIQIKGSGQFLATEYQTEILEPTTMSCTNIDLALYEEQYDMDILSYNGAWLFHGITGVFKDYIDKWMKIKMESTGGMRELAKLHLNALYGKFGSNPDITGKIPYMDDDIVKLKTGPTETKDPIYTAMAVFVTAYARDKMIRTAQENYDTFAYCDTDSLHLLQDTDPENLWVDRNELGAWKFEYAFQRALFIRAKTYIEHKADGDHETHIAGMPVQISEQLTIEDFVAGKKFAGKLNPRRVPGGIVLEDVGFTLPTW
jgi:hypothetical protein